MLASTLQAAEAARPVAPACITSAEFRAGMAFLVPTMVTGIRDKCAASLPRGAYLPQHGDQLVSRFKASGMVDERALSSLIGKIQPNADIPSSANAAMAGIIAQTLVVKMQATLRPADCVSVDKALGLIDPLPAENVVGLFELVGTAVARGDAKKSKAKGLAPEVQFCEAVK
ncbi:MAG: hypothetical protein JWO15_9 [Sphingomonadales bacterium]|nr:hypothetical protein [Sphingomonadales bacterium]